MAVIKPTDIFPNYTSDGTNITIPISDISGLEAGLADAVNGDGAIVFAKMVETTTDNIYALDPTLRPTNVTISRGGYERIGGAESENVRQQYTVLVSMVGDSSLLPLVPET